MHDLSTCRHQSRDYVSRFYQPTVYYEITEIMYFLKNIACCFQKDQRYGFLEHDIA